MTKQTTIVATGALRVNNYRDWIPMVDFLPYPLRKTTFVTSCLLFYNPIPFEMVYSKQKLLPPRFYGIYVLFIVFFSIQYISLFLSITFFVVI